MLLGASLPQLVFQTVANYLSWEKLTILILISQLGELKSSEVKGLVQGHRMSAWAESSVSKSKPSGPPGPLQTQTSGHLGIHTGPLSNSLWFTVEATHLPTSCPPLRLGWGRRQMHCLGTLSSGGNKVEVQVWVRVRDQPVGGPAAGRARSLHRLVRPTTWPDSSGMRKEALSGQEGPQKPIGSRSIVPTGASVAGK